VQVAEPLDLLCGYQNDNHECHESTQAGSLWLRGGGSGSQLGAAGGPGFVGFGIPHFGVIEPGVLAVVDEDQAAHPRVSVSSAVFYLILAELTICAARPK
jgi:hypothetical protein